jgi:sugar fermentation stimulation protein A
VEVAITFSPPLQEGVLVRRYKRFLADVRFADGEQVTALCPNTGSLRSASEPGRPVLLSYTPDGGRKYPYTWQMIRMEHSWVGVNTALPNNLVAMAIQYGMVPELISYPRVCREVRCGKNSRLDFRLEGDPGACYLEVKSVTLAENRVARFPDAVTERGTRHLEELMALQRQGHRAVMLFLVQRNDADIFQPADAIDPVYGDALRRAANAGVEVLVYRAEVSPSAIRWGGPLPKDLRKALSPKETRDVRQDEGAHGAPEKSQGHAKKAGGRPGREKKPGRQSERGPERNRQD